MRVRRRVIKRRRHVHPLVTTAIVLSLLSVGTFYGSNYILEYRKDEANLKRYASGIVQKEKYSRDTLDDAIIFDRKYTTDSSNLVSGEYTIGKFLKEQLIQNDVRCCKLGDRYYTMTGETIMVYSHYVSEEYTREGIIYADEKKRFILPSNISLDDCVMTSTTPYEEMNSDLVISEKEMEEIMKLGLK